MKRGLRRFGLPVWLVAVTASVASLALHQFHARGDQAATQSQTRIGVPAADNPAGSKRRPRPRSDRPSCYLGVVVADVQIDVSSRVEGSVEAIPVAVGDRVEAGQILASLDADIVRHELASARVALEAARAEERRAILRAELAAHAHRRKASLTDILSKEQIEESRYDVESSKLEAEATTARLRQVKMRIEELETLYSWSEIRAPFDGLVGAVYAEPGGLVTRGTPIVRLIGARGRVRFALPPSCTVAVPTGSTVRVRGDDLGHETTATVSTLAPEIDPESQMVFAEALLEPEPAGGDRFPIGSIVRVAAGATRAPCLGGR